MDQFKKQQIKNLLRVVSGAIFAAFMFSALLLFKYGPNNQYGVENILISPDMVFALKFNDKNSKTGGQSRFVFNKMEFEFINSETGVKEKKPVSLDQYTYFYEVAKGNKSIADLSDEIRNLFNRGQAATLKIWVKTESDAAWQEFEKVFQQIDFASNGTYFRIELRQSASSEGEAYAYFYAPEMYQKILNLFSSGQ